MNITKISFAEFFDALLLIYNATLLTIAICVIFIPSTRFLFLNLF